MIEVPWHKKENELPLIKIVGTSAAGKSTLVRALRAAGYNAQPVSQEHSNVPDLWQQFDPLRALIYLDIELAEQRHRRPDVSWDWPSLLKEHERLAHARDHADLRINTSDMSEQEVFDLVLTFLQHAGLSHADQPLPPLSNTGSFRKESTRGDET